jgi:hypothetical protein
MAESGGVGLVTRRTMRAIRTAAASSAVPSGQAESDNLTRTQLRDLPPGEYRSLAKVIYALSLSAVEAG